MDKSLYYTASFDTGFIRFDSPFSCLNEPLEVRSEALEQDSDKFDPELMKQLQTIIPKIYQEGYDKACLDTANMLQQTVDNLLK